MQTRSQTSKQISTGESEKRKVIEPKMEKENIILEFEYDFDYASKCWKENKKSVGNGCYKYVCQGVTKKGKKCNRTALSGEINCKMHLK